VQLPIIHLDRLLLSWPPAATSSYLTLAAVPLDNAISLLLAGPAVGRKKPMALRAAP